VGFIQSKLRLLSRQRVIAQCRQWPNKFDNIRNASPQPSCLRLTPRKVAVATSFYFAHFNKFNSEAIFAETEIRDLWEHLVECDAARQRLMQFEENLDPETPHSSRWQKISEMITSLDERSETHFHEIKCSNPIFFARICGSILTNFCLPI
jgi:hypothetical protein